MDIAESPDSAFDAPPSARPARGPAALEQTSSADLRAAAEDAVSSLGQLCRVSNAWMARQARDRPYFVLGAAAGIGFVLGGGLRGRMTGALAQLAGRLAVTHGIERIEHWVDTSTSSGSPERAFDPDSG